MWENKAINIYFRVNFINSVLELIQRNQYNFNECSI